MADCRILNLIAVRKQYDQAANEECHIPGIGAGMSHLDALSNT
jgi:hypothetical protein